MSVPGDSQDRERIPFGAFLIANNVITPGELEAALILQDERNPKLGRLAHRHQLLTFDKICTILELQRALKISFGEAAIRLGYLSDYEVANLVQEQTANHIYLGELLVELNIMSRTKLRKWLDAYFTTVGEPSGDAEHPSGTLPPSN